MPQEQRPTEKFRTSVGGQALMEGIMMRGPEKICCAVRRPDGTIDLSYSDVTTHWYNKVPLVRGVCNMVENLMNGYKYLMHSADIAMTEEEKEEEKQNESKLDRWLDEHAGPKVQSALMTLSACAGVVLAIFLFTFLPTFLTGLVAKVIPMGRWPRVILEAVLKLAIFLGYMFLCTRMKEIHRMFQYHGAEHKTIACYEAGEELTVANIRRHTRFHPRCGTSFLILVILVSIGAACGLQSILHHAHSLARQNARQLLWGKRRYHWPSSGFLGSTGVTAAMATSIMSSSGSKVVRCCSQSPGTETARASSELERPAHFKIS